MKQSIKINFTKKALDLLNLNQRIIDFIDKDIKTKITNNQQGFKCIAIFLFTKSTKTARAIQSLCLEGFGQDAAILARSLLENLIVLSYIGKEDTDRRAKLFFGHSEIDYKNYFDKNSYLLDDERYSKIDEGVKKRHNEIYKETVGLKKEECERIKQKGYKLDKKSWSCLSLSKMAEETGLGEIYYGKAYWFISQFSHPHLGSFKGYIVENNNGSLIVNDMPSEIFVQDALEIAVNAYLMIINKFNDIFQLGLDQLINPFFNDYTCLMKES